MAQLIALILALAVTVASAPAVDLGSVVVTCSCTLSAAQYAALEVEAARLSTPAAPVSVPCLVGIWALQEATARANTLLRAALDTALAAEAVKPPEQRPIATAVQEVLAAEKAKAGK